MKAGTKTKKPSLRPDAPDADNPAWTKADFARSKRVWDIPELAHLSTRARGPQKAPTKRQVTLRLDRDVVDKFRATGAGWQSRINEALKKAPVE
jgi:uncharacterized protein (DUF4415 family)